MAHAATQVGPKIALATSEKSVRESPVIDELDDQKDERPLRAAPATSVRPLKVLFLTDGMEAITAGGTERQLLQFVALAKGSGAIPQICILRDTAWLTEALAGCPVRHYAIGRVRSLAGMKQIADIVRWMRREKFDVLQTVLTDASLLGPLMGKMAGIPVMVGTRRNLALFAQPPSRAERLLLRLSDRLFDDVQANSEAVAEHVVRWERIPRRKISVIYNGIDTERLRVIRAMGASVRRHLGVNEEHLLVGNISGLRAVKRLDLFLEAAQIAVREHPHLRFVVVGEGDQRSQLEKLIRACGLDGIVTLAGAQEDVRPWLAAMDIAVLCSDAEGFSNSVLEYMAAGLPVVATEVGGNREALGEAGMVIPPGDAQQLAEAIGALTNEQDRCRISAAALESVQRFDRCRAQEKMRSVYAKYAAWVHRKAH
ncbi:MAG TPA: glycosyltransferase [Acidobacteriaceae bacterium]